MSRHFERREFILCFATAFFVGYPVLAGNKDLKTIPVSLKLRTGGEISGAVLDSNEHGLVILNENVPYVFGWVELEPQSALATKRNLIALDRGGADRLTAEDHFQLGMLVLRAGRNDLGAHEFEKARKLDRTYTIRIKEAFAHFRREADVWKIEDAEPVRKDKEPASQDDESDASRRAGTAFEQLPPPSPQVRADVRDAYLKFGDKVRDVLGQDIQLIESNHFLIWSDWAPKERTNLAKWLESVYLALCTRFGLNADEDVFLAKCPVFCFRSKARFARFARDFDGYEAKNAIGYTRSIEDNGHVHIVFARIGSAPFDYDRFACTLVHEGTHAFLHRVYGTHLLPHWLNEGLAEFTAQRVLGDRCPAGENATLLAQQYARFGWSAMPLLNRLSTIAIHEYPLAHSIVAHLDSRNSKSLANLIRDLKQGMDLPAALAATFDGLTLERLEKDWKETIPIALPESRKNAEATGHGLADQQVGGTP